MTELSPGLKLSHYQIASKHGAGGRGEVYLAHDTMLDSRVALKVLPADVAAHPDRMKRFVQEAKSASALNHSNIVTINEIDETDSGHFMPLSSSRERLYARVNRKDSSDSLSPSR